MRETKYKAWHKIRNKMYKVWSLFWFDDGMRVDIYGMGDREETSEDIENVILIEYTGLHDKNGKEIYEGDILQIWMGGDKQIRPYVIESLRSFYADLDTTDSYMRISDFELIGSVQENPELLEADKVTSKCE